MHASICMTLMNQRKSMTFNFLWEITSNHIGMTSPELAEQHEKILQCCVSPEVVSPSHQSFHSILKPQ